jgi:hypothetical protein
MRVGVGPFSQTDSEDRSGSCGETIIDLLVDVGAGVIQCRVEADSVVLAFNEREDGSTSRLAVRPDVQVDQLLFQGCKE